MVVVPRLFEVLRTRISKAIEKQGKLPAWLLDRAQAVGARDYERKARLIDMPMKLLLGRTLQPKIAQRFGGRMKAMAPGGAPLNPATGLFFQSLGPTFLQGSGHTAAAAVISSHPPFQGQPMDT